MENIKNILSCMGTLRSLCVEIDTTWKTVLGDRAAELDSEGGFAAAINTVVSSCGNACGRISAVTGLPCPQDTPVPTVDLHQFRTKAYFQGLLQDTADEGEVYLDIYKTNYQMQLFLRQRAEQFLTCAQDMVAYCQNMEAFADVVIEEVNAVLGVASGLYGLLLDIANWHWAEADRCHEQMGELAEMRKKNANAGTY